MATPLFIKRCLLGTGISFLGMAIVCILLYPAVFQHYEYGLSYFGSISITFIPYYLGFTLTIIFTLLVARRLQELSRPLSVAFYAFALFMTGVAVTSYSLSRVAYVIHWAFAVALTVCILVAIFWLLKQGNLTSTDYLLITTILVTVLVSALPIVQAIPIVKVYILREMLVFICSLWLLGRAVSRI